jgi:cation-transporting P-type ATPase E
MTFVLPAGITLFVLGLGIYVADLLANPGADALGLARTVLTTLTTFGGLLLILFAEPPTSFWMTAPDDHIGDWRPAIVASVLGVSYIIIMLVPGLRDFFELSPLRLVDYGVIAVALVAWIFILRYIWRAHIFARFLRLKLA